MVGWFWIWQLQGSVEGPALRVCSFFPRQSPEIPNSKLLFVNFAYSASRKITYLEINVVFCFVRLVQCKKQKKRQLTDQSTTSALFSSTHPMISRFTVSTHNPTPNVPCTTYFKRTKRTSQRQKNRFGPMAPVSQHTGNCQSGAIQKFSFHLFSDFPP